MFSGISYIDVVIAMGAYFVGVGVTCIDFPNTLIGRGGQRTSNCIPSAE